jgi:hypothetical protein
MLRRLLLLSGCAVLTVLAVGLSGAEARHSPAFVCDADFNNLVVSGNLIVPTNATCQIGDGSTVGGNVQVEDSGHFTAGKSEVHGDVSAGASGTLLLDGLTVDGSVSTQNETSLEVAFGAHVGRDVTVEGGPEVVIGGDSGGATVGGNVMVSDAPGGNPANFYVIIGVLTVGGNVVLLNNQARTAVGATRIGRNLICSGNADLIGGNVTARRKLGQCAGF